MDSCSKNGKGCPNLLDLIPKAREWVVKRDEERVHVSSVEKNLELKLGPPGIQEWSMENSSKNIKERDNEKSINLSLGYSSSMCNNTTNRNLTPKFSSSENTSSPWSSKGSSFLQFPSTTHQRVPAMVKESSQPCSSKVVDLQSAENKAILPPPANTAVPNSSQKRAASGPVVGWPPIRSFRKNLVGGSSSKVSPDPQNGVPNKKIASEKQVESCSTKGLFVKINMDGIPIGRKVDLKAYDSYEKLSKAVDELFRGLLAAQKDSSACGIMDTEEEEKPITGVLDGSGEYTLVYEDNEGDRMLVGDVPWHMFVSMVKRLRVLKSSDVSVLSLSSGKLERTKLDSAALK